MTTSAKTAKTETTDKTETTETVNDTAKVIGISSDEIEEIHDWLTKTRVDQCAQSLAKWFRIGDICLRIKTADLEGKFKDNVNAFLGCDITNDERQYSMKLYDAKSGVEAWYNKIGCMKYNPRTIWVAYQAKDDLEMTPEDKKKATAKKKEDAEKKALRKERTGSDTLKAFTDYKKIRDNAGENGNLVAGDLKILKAGLEAEMKAIEELLAVERIVER